MGIHFWKCNFFDYQESHKIFCCLATQRECTIIITCVMFLSSTLLFLFVTRFIFVDFGSMLLGSINVFFLFIYFLFLICCFRVIFSSTIFLNLTFIFFLNVCCEFIFFENRTANNFQRNSICIYIWYLIRLNFKIQRLTFFNYLSENSCLRRKRSIM